MRIPRALPPQTQIVMLKYRMTTDESTNRKMVMPLLEVHNRPYLKTKVYFRNSK